MSKVEGDEDHVQVGGCQLEVVNNFKYLLSTLTSDSDVSEEVKIRIGAASRASWAINTILKSNILSRSTKIQAYVTIIRPIATEGCETWRLTVFENGL